MRMFQCLLLAVVFSVMVGCPVTHAKPRERYDPDSRTTRKLEFKNLRAGYKLFRSFCKKCHTRNNPEAVFLYTESRTMKGWNNVFYKQHPECAKRGYWHELTKKQLMLVNDYLYYNAYDSYDPEDDYGYGPGLFFYF